MGKALSRPGCLRQSPCCSKKSDREAYNEDGYIPQRSIYDTMCINEQIDHSSAHSTLGSRRGRETDFSSNGSLGGDMFDTRSSVLLTGGRRLDERFIFDSLKLANDELRSPGGFVRSASPSVSCSSAPGGSMNKRLHHQDSGKKDSLCRHSWKVLSPPKFPEPLELSPGEKNFLNPGVAFFPSSMTSPQISPFSGSPFSTGTHTPSVFFSPSPLPYTQQFHRQSLPTQPSSPRPPLSELSVSALMSGQDLQVGIEKVQEIRGHEIVRKEQTQFETFKPRPVEPISEQQPTTPEPDHDTAPLLHPVIPKGPTICKTSIESTWPRRLIGRRRTVRQGGAVHNLPILPPLPSLLIRSVSDKKPTPRLSPFPEHQGKVEGHLSKSMLKNELNDCPLQDWKILREIEDRKAGSNRNELQTAEVTEKPAKMSPLQEKPEESVDEIVPPECEVENWEAVLEMVNSLWEETWKDSESSQNLGSLRRWPVLHPPTGFGGSQAPSGASSELGPEDLLELERICREDSIDSELFDLLHSQSDSELKEIKCNVVVTQPSGQRLDQPGVPVMLDLGTAGAQLRNKDGQTESPDSNLTLDSDSSGVFMSNTSHTSKEDISSDGDRSVSELDFGRATIPHKGTNEQAVTRITGTSKPERTDHKRSTLDKSQTFDNTDLSKFANLKKVQTKGMSLQNSSKSMDSGSLGQEEICNTVKTSKADMLLQLTPSKHDIRGTLLDSGDFDPFVATDSFVYLAVSLPPPPTTRTNLPRQEGASVPAGNDPSLPATTPKPGPHPDECDFLSTDSFVYLAAPDCHLLVAEGRSVYDSKDSDSEDSGSRADFVQASTVGEDSDWDSDLSDSDHEWDHWEELEQEVLQGLFCEDQPETERGCSNNKPAWQISCQRAESAAGVAQDNAGASSQRAQAAEPHAEMESVS